MIVCIAEKPSVARDIANVLGATQTQQGYIEGNGYQVTWTFGHLCELKEPHEYAERWQRWDLWDLPMLPQRFGIRLKEDEGIKRQFAIIEKLFSQADMIVNCGDAGQEGELIQRWVMQKAGVKCPVKRLWISSLTEEAIREGFQKLKDQSEYQSLYEAGLSRAIGDWTLGMNATRLYTLKYQEQRGQVLSIGRVQTPTLALIVNRQKEIEDFVPRQSWGLQTLYRDTKFTAITIDEEAEAEAQSAQNTPSAPSKKSAPTYRQLEYTTEAEGRDVLQAITGQPFTITNIQKKKGTEAPPRLYDLTSLQVDCNKKFSYSADQTLQLIQSLYEKKLTTYPRVDTTFLSDDIYPKCPSILKGIRGYETFTQPLEGKTLTKSKKVFDSSKVTDHHAIIPTGQPAQGLTDMERNVYDLVARAFIAVFYPDCKFETTTVFGTVPLSGKAESILFRTSGRIILDEGWKVVYKKDDLEAQETQDSQENLSTKKLPLFTKGETGLHSPSLVEKWTQPPKPYTEATLLRAMETAGKFVDDDELRDAMKENGIGRPSTRAAIIETLFKRRYIRKERKTLVATPTGVELIGLIREELLKSAELTGRWEKKLRDIEHHQYPARQFIDELKQMVTDIVVAVRNDQSNRRVAFTSEEDLKKKKKRGGGANQSSSQAGLSTPSSPTSISSPSSISSPVSSAGSAGPAGFQPRSQHAPFDADQWVGMPCPLCHEGVIIKGRTAYGCSRWREGCTYRRPFAQL
ncbi:MAG: DNA topoisomerase 3 [Bacteroidaceae bacterium]|nr:DNA topoisomerase 3 [Bacteroidaceae bacterium]